MSSVQNPSIIPLYCFLGIPRSWILDPPTNHQPTGVLNTAHMLRRNPYVPIQDGAPKIAKLPYKWLNYELW